MMKNILPTKDFSKNSASAMTTYYLTKTFARYKSYLLDT
jgi:hypothetical protein